jgi:L-glyceraldehyde 3-phosphate reductase
MFERWVEGGLLDVLEKYGVGCIPFSPLAQGLLTDRYLNGIPVDSRVARNGFLKAAQVTDDKLKRIRQLNELALQRGQTLAQMALAWLLKDERVTSVLIGASKPAQLLDSIQCLQQLSFSKAELDKIDTILK